MEVKLLIGALGGPHESHASPKGSPGAPRGQKWLKMTIKVKKLENHNRINNQDPFFFGTRPGGKVSLEVKLLIEALGGPHELLSAPKSPQWPTQRSKMAKNDHKSRKIEKP